MRLSARSTLIAFLWLGVLVLTGTLATARTLGVFLPRADDWPVDTKLEPGNHVTFVLIPSAGRPTKKQVAAVARARLAFRKYADSRGYYFSTVGVAVQTHPNVGMWILKQYGRFDELDVGRSWFNSGLKRYVKDMGDEGTLPQVIAVLDTIEVGQRDWTPIRRTELARFVGWHSVNGWEANGYPIPVEDGRRGRKEP